MTSIPEAPTPTAADSVAPDANAWETLQTQNQQLREQVAKLEHQLKQLQRMIFGQRSERHVPDNPHQLSLGEGNETWLSHFSFPIHHQCYTKHEQCQYLNYCYYSMV